VTSLRLHLTLTYLAVILLGIGVAAPLAWLAVEGLYLETQQANLLAQAELVAKTLPPTQAPPLEGSDPYSQLLNVAPGIHTRLVEAEGRSLSTCRLFRRWPGGSRAAAVTGSKYLGTSLAGRSY
jgi:hypothetical protein